MLLAMDVGNTNTVFALFENNTLIHQWRISTNARRTADEYAMWILPLLERVSLAPERIQRAIVASVVPPALFELRLLCERYFPCPLQAISKDITDLGIEIAVDNPREVGADRLVNAVAAIEKYHTDCIVVDFGTATTFDVVSKEHGYKGGVIAPGVQLSLNALQQAAAKLPNVSVEKPAHVIGTNTISAMQSGIYYGYLSMIEGVVARIKAEEQKPMIVIATGGLAPLYAKSTTIIDYLEPDLTLMGLYILNSRV